MYCSIDCIIELPEELNCQLKQVASLHSSSGCGVRLQRETRMYEHQEQDSLYLQILWGNRAFFRTNHWRKGVFAVYIFLKVLGRKLVVFSLILYATSCMMAQSLAEGPLQAPQCCHLQLSDLSLPNWVSPCCHTLHKSPRAVISISNCLWLFFLTN